MEITRRDTLKGTGKVVGLSALPANDGALWRELQKDILPLRAESRERDGNLPLKFQDCGYDPRDWRDCDLPLPIQLHAEEFEQAFDRAGLGPVLDRLEAVSLVQDSISDRMVDAKPTTLAGLLAQISVCLGVLDWSVDPVDDFSVKALETANHALAAAEALA